MPASMNIDQAKGKNASGPITRRRFVKMDPGAADGESVEMCNTAGEFAYGVSLFNVSFAAIARGKGCSVITDGRAIVEQDGTVTTVGQLVATDATGRARLAQAGDFILGYCDENAGGAAGTEISVNLSLGGGKA